MHSSYVLLLSALFDISAAQNISPESLASWAKQLGGPQSSNGAPVIPPFVSRVLPSSVLPAASTVTAFAAVSTKVVYSTVQTTVTISPSDCAAPPPAQPSVQPSSSECPLPSSPLTNKQQVGDSVWGTLCQPTFPKWLNGTDGAPYTSPPWGNATTKNTDATVQGAVPNTNVTRHYNFTLSRGRISTDGVLRDVILVNDQFPGPAIEANWGDWLEITVNNKIYGPEEGTAMHWHAMLQRGTPWQDGVPGISQCPIAPGHTFTYKFQAELYGTSWYHAHYSAQYTAGLAGPMIIHGPSSAEYDIDIGPVMFSDWYHIPYFSIVSNTVGTDLSVIPPISDNVLINGRGNFDCSKSSYSNSSEWLGSNLKSNISWTCVEGAAKSQFKFTKGKVHRLRLINHGADGVHKISIDGHKLTVIATDYVPVVPYETDLVTLAVGQRTDVLVTADKDASSSWWLRTVTTGGPLCGGSNTPEALAAIYYDAADTNQTPTSTNTNLPDTSCSNDALAKVQPDYAITPSENPVKQNLRLTIQPNATGHGEWRINNQTYRANFNEPLLPKAAAGNVNFPNDPQWNVYNLAQNKSVVLNVTNATPFAHPFHLHGHNFFVLNEGRGLWDGNTVIRANPMRRDVQIIQGFGYAAIQFELDNPGVWSFHCHVAWHLSGGLAANFVSQPQDIGKVPDGIAQTCKDWSAYTNAHVVDQIDAGA